MESQIVGQTFGGLFCSVLACSRCGYASSTIASFMEINLDIVNKKEASISIEEALSEYMRSEAMPDYKCSHCLIKGGCDKLTTIHTLPQTLCLHLKRFEEETNANGQNEEKFDKIDEFVQFPVDELLDLAQFVNEEQKRQKVNDKKYRLRSIICHSGDLSSGHYVCCVRKGEEWFYLDDGNVHKSSVKLVRQTCPYMLFYEAT